MNLSPDPERNQRERCSIDMAQRSDCKAIAQLGRDVWGEWSNGKPLPMQLIELNHPVLISRDHSGKLAGYLIGLFEASGISGHILSVTISETHRRMGIGEQLVERAVSFFSASRAQSVTAIITAENQPSQALFRKLGFDAIEEIEDYYGPGEAAIRFAMALSDSP
ncbi:GNAT family N-acetyltransferase [bacterium]|nr:GNAT family N-acetyltransferase [bacterium]